VSADVSETEDESGQPGEVSPEEPKKKIGPFRETTVLVLIAFAFALIVKSFFVQAFFIPSGSMYPTLVGPGDRILVNKLASGLPSRGDILVFRNPLYVAPDRGPVSSVLHWMGEGIGVGQAKDEFLVKRVIGLPGDTVDVKADGVYIDGQLLSEPYANLAQGTGALGTWKVPDGYVFMMGDHRGRSGDSRVFGPVAINSIAGRVFLRVWPPSRFGGV